ncbi:MAG: YlxR family protein [Acidimicrobiales bacterium]
MGCRATATPSELVRVVRLRAGSIVIGPTMPGRGAWLHARSIACFDQAVGRKAFARSLRGTVSDDAIAALRTDFVQRTETARD